MAALLSKLQLDPASKDKARALLTLPSYYKKVDESALGSRLAEILGDRDFAGAFTAAVAQMRLDASLPDFLLRFFAAMETMQAQGVDPASAPKKRVREFLTAAGISQRPPLFSRLREKAQALTSVMLAFWRR